MVILPSYPRVFSEDDIILIEYEEGKRHVWGREKSREKAIFVAEQMDLELKISAYIQENSNIFLNELYNSITSMADDEVVLELMNQALYQWIRKTQ